MRVYEDAADFDVGFFFGLREVLRILTNVSEAFEGRLLGVMTHRCRLAI